MWGFIVALISGALMSIQGVFNTEVTKQTSLWVSTGWVQLSAFAVCVFAWLFTGRESVAALWQVDNKYTLLGGVIGAFITITVIQSMGALGPARAAMLIVISQLAVAYVIELFGLFGVDKEPFEWRKILGLLIAISGIVIRTKQDKDQSAKRQNVVRYQKIFQIHNRCACAHRLDSRQQVIS